MACFHSEIPISNSDFNEGNKDLVGASRFDRTEERGEARVKEAVRGTAHGSPTLWYYSGIFQKFLGC
ncbi:hypothetical protein ERO13_A03G109400v2 [Gossypium hirsutum]|uniref:Uncharacterized protein n=3 Tax=Gossypium TaxID=3633 RepID=A0A5D2ZZR7_GOSMU|nr:hypothetical protein ERO13_1Z049331v2 [Gossypium hirsutum]KAG4208089.1 hypothetical protein ERO13_A03G109400v2 [Gossypium hirsutum]TYH25011.1 hypothetical protein ES288_A03G135800v1 [Gossypium darwinii]TYJ43006.1 hypothetical protein E1A91_A03G124900v1 [Gossypium mustelinum]